MSGGRSNIDCLHCGYEFVQRKDNVVQLSDVVRDIKEIA